MSKYRPQRNYGCRIHDEYTYFGMRTLVLENDLVRISLLLDKGTDVYEYLYKPTGVDLMWLSDTGVQNPNDYLPTSPHSDATFLNYYAGGWQEVFPNGGPQSKYQGAHFGQHGEVAHMNWDYEMVEDTPSRVAVRLRVRTKKVPFELRKVLILSDQSPTLFVEEELENLSGVPMNYMWGHHLAFGKPLIEPGSLIDLPQGVRVITEAVDSPVSSPGRVRRGGEQIWPFVKGIDDEPVNLSVLPEHGSPSDILYLTGFGERAWYSIRNPRTGMALNVEWDGERLPYLWFWQEYGETKVYPWYGRHYNIGLEPFSSYPTHGLSEAIRNGSASAIGPREIQSFSMSLTPSGLPGAPMVS